MSFDPEAFFKSLRKELPTDPYYTLTFEEFLKKKNLWETYKDKLDDKYNNELSKLRFKYSEVMRWRLKKLERLNESSSAQEILRKTDSDLESDSE